MNTIRMYEELQLNAWPALQTLMVDGWILRFANGYTKRANSVQSLYPSTMPFHEKIDECESLYHSKGLPAVFKLTEIPEAADLDAALEQRGYALIDPVSVQVRNLDVLPQPFHGDVTLSPVITDEWLQDFCELHPSHREHHGTIREMFTHHKLDCCFAALKRDGRTVACGLAVSQHGRVGLFDIVTDQTYRRQGLAESLILHLLHWAKENHAHEAYLQVLKENTAALRLYEKLGFEENYPHWYRIKR